MSPAARAALAAAKAHLDAQRLYPRPVSLRGVRIHTVPWLFRLPFMRRFDGYATYQTILLSKPLADVSLALVTHELCHVWQMQHHPIRMPLSYLRGYDDNRYELEARRAASGV
jgi:hypothetical protein